ncbi:MerR family transcriptional regulator [Streptomyces formicae]
MTDSSRQPSDRGAGLTTGEVARRLGVAPTTLRTWDRRYGIGPARQGGRHRRWTPQDIEVLDSMCRLTSKGVPPAEAARASLADAPNARLSPPTAAASPTSAASPHARETREPRAAELAERHIRGLRRAALRLDALAVEGLLETAVTEFGLVAAWEQVIMPALHAVGRKWETSGERFVEVEHLLSWHVSSVLRRVRGVSSDPPFGPPVLLACVPGEGHTLPLEALAAALCERGTSVAMFGGAVPAEALESAVRRIGPTAIVLWAQSLSTASRPLAQQVSAMEWGMRGARRRPSVVIAGPGWAGRSVPGTLRPHRLTDAVDMLAAPPPRERMPVRSA